MFIQSHCSCAIVIGWTFWEPVLLSYMTLVVEYHFRIYKIGCPRIRKKNALFSGYQYHMGHLILYFLKWYSTTEAMLLWRPRKIKIVTALDVFTVFPHIVSAKTILFWKKKCENFSYSFHIMAFFYFVNWIVATKTIEGGKLFKGGNYLGKYGTLISMPILRL